MQNIRLDAGAAALLARLHGAGYAAYAVGGCVRDSLLGRIPQDWDLCTSARPEQVLALFGEGQCVPTGLQHGTVTIKYGGQLYETTTFRTEGAYTDGRHPDEVHFVPDVRQDLARRDFTINAMAYNDAEGLIDPFGGQQDLQQGILRAVGDPATRFEEDALRILRLYRFAARFGFAIDPPTGQAARALCAHLDCVSVERIEEELSKLLAAPAPAAYLDEKILKVIIPELSEEDIETGSRAAAAGGYTFVNLMPNTKPVCSSAAQAAMVEQKAAEVGLCDVNQTVSITEDFDGKTIDHLKTLPASVKFITEDGHGVQDNATMARAFAICTQRDITVMSHAEDMEISPWDYRLAEDIETVRNCWLSEYYQTRLHMCHVSTRGAIEAIQMAKLRGAPVTCEVTPHHLWFTNDTCDYRVNPPIRTADDVQALIDAIRSGVVDAIATDHAPHSEEDKLKGMAGMVGSETAFGVCYTKLCKEEGLPLELLSHLMSTRPAEILGLAKGQLEPGYDADFVLVDLDTPYTVDKNKLHSKSHNCPFDGAQLYGRVCATVKGGELTYQAEE